MLFVAIVLACAIYVRSLRGEFLFDDHAIKDMDFPRRALIYSGHIEFDHPGNNTSPPMSCAQIMFDNAEDCGNFYVYRPSSFQRALRSFFLEPRALTHIGYLWTWRLTGFDPEAWHAVNLYLHCANIYLVYLYAKLFLPVYPAGIAALIFAVHPLQVAAVSYMSGRAGIQCTFFSLAAVLIFAEPSFWVWPVGFLAVTLAMRSKEDAPLWLMLFATTLGVWRLFFGSI